MPSEFLLLKPFTKAPSLQIELPEPGRSKATLLSVQNIDDTSSRVYFEIPAGKPLKIKPETIVIQPQSVELFEIIAVDPKESFRATIKVFAPDMKYYRGGQVNVTVTVKQPVKVEKKKRPKPITSSNVKPKSVTVPAEFHFQPSREQRKNGPSSTDSRSENVNQISTKPPVLGQIDQTFNLEDIRRQTHLIKQAIDVNQTYLVTSKVECDPKDPIAFVKHTMENERQDLTVAIAKYLEFAKSQGLPLEAISECRRHAINDALIRSQAKIQAGCLFDVLEELANIPSSIEEAENVPPSQYVSGKTLGCQNKKLQILQRSRRSSQRPTSSPKRESCDQLQTPEKLSGISNMTLREMVSNFLPDTSVSQMASMTVESPNVSAIFPINGNNL